MTERVLVILADGFEEIEAITPIDILRRCGLRVVTASIGESLNVEGSHNITVKADKYLSDVANDIFDMVLLPGGPGTRHLRENALVGDIVRRQARDGRGLAAICAAPTILAATGVLGGRNATCYPACEPDMGAAKILHEEVVIDSNIITSRGAGTAMAFALAVAESLVGGKKAGEVARGVIYKV